MCKNPLIRNNLIAVCYLWASSGFISYLLSFYSKYFKGNVFVNFSMIGSSEALSMIWTSFLKSNLKLKNLLVVFYVLIIVLSLILSFFINYGPEYGSLIIIPSLLLAIRLQSSSLSNYGYVLNCELFPVLVRSQVFGISNLVSRPFSAVSTIVTEYTKQPLIYCILVSLVSFFFIRIIREPSKND